MKRNSSGWTSDMLGERVCVRGSISRLLGTQPTIFGPQKLRGLQKQTIKGRLSNPTLLTTVKWGRSVWGA